MAKPVEENYLITIKGTMEQNGENDTVELMTRGNFVQRGNSYYIVYAETEATGYAGCTTTVRVSQDARLVSMTRFGKTSSLPQVFLQLPCRMICRVRREIVSVYKDTAFFFLFRRIIRPEQHG